MSLTLRRLWESPTFATGASTATRLLSVVIVLPLMLRRLTPPEIALWYLLSTIAGLQFLADLGFAPTFTRLIAYAMGGMAQIRDLPLTARQPGKAGDLPNWGLVERIASTMRVIYWRVSLPAVVLLGVLGTWALVRPMRALEDPGRGWVAWGIVLVVSGSALWANQFGAYLQGLNQVAVYRRWEAISSLGAIVTSSIVLLMGGRVLGLVLASQSWVVLGVLRNWQLARRAAGGRLKSFGGGLDPEIVSVAWPSAWRSGMGISLGRGVVFASGLIYAQVAQAAALSVYLVALRAIQVIAEFSQAPFYSKIPEMARLRSTGNFAEQLVVARRAMRMAYWVYVAGFVSIGVFGRPLLDAIGSQVEFPDPLLWLLLGLGFFVERYGAMHIQLYTTTNHVIWHIATGVSGLINLTLSLLLLRPLGVYAFPIAMLVGYLGFFSWYSSLHVYRLFQTRFFAFERTVILPPALVVSFYAVLVLFR